MFTSWRHTGDDPQQSEWSRHVMPWHPWRQSFWRQFSPEQQSALEAHDVETRPHVFEHCLLPAVNRLRQYGATPQHPPAEDPTEHASPSHEVCGETHVPPTQLRPRQQGEPAEQAPPSGLHAVGVACVHTAPAHVSPAQHAAEEAHGWPPRRQAAAGAWQRPLTHERPAQHAELTEQVAPAVRHAWGYSHTPLTQLSPSQQVPAEHALRQVPHEGADGSHNAEVALHVPLQQSADVRQSP